MTLFRPAFRLALAALCGSLLFAGPAPARADEVTLRMATLAPNGSSWMKQFETWKRNIESKTAGRVKVKFYAGGIAGDDKDYVRKIKLGQLSGAALTGVGLSTIDTDVRTVEVARTYEELDELRGKLNATLRKRLADKGYIVLGWGDVGPVHLFSKNPIQSMADLQAAKMWLWADDPVSVQMFKALNMKGVPLGPGDVLPNLQTDAVNAFFGTPLSTLALQWHTKVGYMSSMVMTQATGAIVLGDKDWKKLSPEDQKVVADESAGMEREVLKMIRHDNERALSKMKKPQGSLEVLQTSPEFEKDLRSRGEAVALEIGKNLSPETKGFISKYLEAFKAHQHK